MDHLLTFDDIKKDIVESFHSLYTHFYDTDRLTKIAFPKVRDISPVDDVPLDNSGISFKPEKRKVTDKYAKRADMRILEQAAGLGFVEPTEDVEIERIELPQDETLRSTNGVNKDLKEIAGLNTPQGA